MPKKRRIFVFVGSYLLITGWICSAAMNLTRIKYTIPSLRKLQMFAWISTQIKMASKSRTSKGKASVYFKRGMSEEISYEDVLLAQYMDEIQKAPPVRKDR